MNFREMTKEQLLEESLIDLAYAMLESKHQALTLPELMKEISNINGLSEEEMNLRLLQFYTDLNTDGRFLATSESRWGLRQWYPLDQIAEETAPTVKVRKKKAKAAVEEDEFEEELEEDEIEFEEDFDEFVEDESIDEEDEEDIDFEEDDIEEIEEEIDEDLLEEDEDFEIVDDEEESDEEEFEEE